MIRLHITAEGQTERSFVQKVLAPYLVHFNVFADARCVLTSADKQTGKQYRGGVPNYQKARADIIDWMKEDRAQECRFTTMFDFYALPNDFPGYTAAQEVRDPYSRINLLEQAVAADISDSRFLPYIQLHEFEALILADPQKLDWEYLDHEKSIGRLCSMVGDQNPELINDGFETAPSKRILREIPEYNKPTAGVAVVEKIGLKTLRERCKHFDQWVGMLEQLGK